MLPSVHRTFTEIKSEQQKGLGLYVAYSQGLTVKFTRVFLSGN